MPSRRKLINFQRFGFRQVRVPGRGLPALVVKAAAPAGKPTRTNHHKFSARGACTKCGMTVPEASRLSAFRYCEGEARLERQAMDEMRNPGWGQATEADDWRHHVPEDVRTMWGTFSDAQRIALATWADSLAEDCVEPHFSDASMLQSTPRRLFTA